MFQRVKSNMNLVVGLMMAGTLGLITLGAVASAAQDTSSDTVRPANVHVGSCDNLGEVAAELKDLVVLFDDDDDNGGASGPGSTDASTPGSNTGSGGDDGGDDSADDTGGGSTPGSSGGDDGGDDGADDTGGGEGDDGNDDGNDDDADDSGFGGNYLASTNALQTGGGEFVGAQDASIVEGSEGSDIGTNLDALLAEPHAIAVYESEGSDTVIACGTIGGYLRDDGDDDGDDQELAIGLREQNDSGFAGVALLDDDDDDNELDVDVYIGRDVAGGA